MVIGVLWGMGWGGGKMGSDICGFFYALTGLIGKILCKKSDNSKNITRNDFNNVKYSDKISMRLKAIIIVLFWGKGLSIEV